MDTAMHIKSLRGDEEEGLSKAELGVNHWAGATTTPMSVERTCL